MIASGPEVVAKFNWPDLHKKIVRIVVAEPNPDVMELGHVFAHDLESGKVYVLLEYGYEGGNEI